MKGQHGEQRDQLDRRTAGTYSPGKSLPRGRQTLAVRKVRVNPMPKTLTPTNASKSNEPTVEEISEPEYIRLNRQARPVR